MLTSYESTPVYWGAVTQDNLQTHLPLVSGGLGEDFLLYRIMCIPFKGHCGGTVTSVWCSPLGDRTTPGAGFAPETETPKMCDKIRFAPAGINEALPKRKLCHPPSA